MGVSKRCAVKNPEMQCIFTASRSNRDFRHVGRIFLIFYLLYTFFKRFSPTQETGRKKISLISPLFFHFLRYSKPKHIFVFITVIILFYYIIYIILYFIFTVKLIKTDINAFLSV